MRTKLGAALLGILTLAACGNPTPPVQNEQPDGSSSQQSSDGGPGFVATPQAGLEIEIASGKVRGTQEGELRVFRGIPFAKPPIGERRFRAPVPVDHWEKTFEASAFGPSCPQDMPGVDTMSEDCLSINVWAHDDDVVRPVMVYIYGGAFISGSSAMSTYDATSLAQNGDMVMVTFNYRLGVLGFLATEALGAQNGGVAGNYGLQDQVEALRWVQTNIRAFGGDPTNVTIFGESAGAISVCALHGAPEADALFHKGIMQSGTCALASLSGQGTLGGAPVLEAGAKVVEALGCKDAFDQVACLQSKPVEELRQAASLTSLLTGDFESISALMPSVDGKFITARPLDRIRSGAVDKPLIVGSNEDEGVLFTSADIVLTRWDLEDKFKGFVKDDAVTAELMDLYPMLDFLLPKDAWSAFMGEVAFICPGLSVAQAAAGGASSYTYHFTRTNLITSAMGAAHGLDIPYVFGTFDAMNLPATQADRELSARMQQAWTSFARTGTPQLSPSWIAFNSSAPAIAILDDTIEVVPGIRDGRCAKLKELGLVE